MAAITERIRGKGKNTVIDQERWAILVAEYDHANNARPLDSYGPCSNKSVQWICPEKGHLYTSSICNRYKGTKCSFCHGKAVGPDNCLAATHPDLAAQWHPTLNEKTPQEIKAGCNTKYWWICEKGHEWDATPNSRSKGTGCRHCTGRTTADGNTLAAKFPEIAAEWSFKNKLKPDEVTSKSTKIVWWICPKGHEYEAMIGNRTGGTGCSFCAGKEVCEDNSFATHYPDLASQWHPTKNEKNPSSFSKSSGASVWWKCEKDHEWLALITNRIKGHKCPYCSGRYPTPDVNLAVCHPHLVKEWHPTKNSKTPYEFTPSSHTKVWWQCLSNSQHVWEAKINNRTVGNKSNCPLCNKSKLELAVNNTLTSLEVDFKSEVIFQDMKQYRFDFFISAYKTLIECDGEQHFMNSSKFYSTHVRGKNFEEQQESDRIKTQYAVDNGYTILRIAYTELSRVDQILKEFVDKQLWKTSEKVHLYPIELYTWLGHKESTIESLKAENKFLKAENESLKLQLEELLKRQNEKPNIIEHV